MSQKGRSARIAFAFLFGVASTAQAVESPGELAQHYARIQRDLLVAAAATRSTGPLTPEQADRWRIQQHLARVEAGLRSAVVPGASAIETQSRAKNLELLHAYWVAGRFPRNTQHAEQLRPYFIDDEGVACAVAHLLEKTGSLQLAREVDRELHNAYVPEMNHAGLAAWASASGLTVAELAQIQPSYCMCGSDGSAGAGGQDGEQTYDPVCGSDGLTYWNECAANLCAQVSVAHAGECELPARCEVCGVGTRLPVVAECAESPGEETLVGVCQRSGGEQVVSVNLLVAQHWLELQGLDCPADTDYGAAYPPGNSFDFSGWRGISDDENWDCSLAGAPNNEPTAGASPLPEAGGSADTGGGGDAPVNAGGGVAKAASHPHQAPAPATIRAVLSLRRPRRLRALGRGSHSSGSAWRAAAGAATN